MKKLLLLVLAVIAMLSLSACGNDGAPDDMQLVAGGEREGYYFYGPEDWIISNTKDIASTYISNLNNTSISFAEIDKDSFGQIGIEGCTRTECKGEKLDGKTHFFLYHYLEAERESFPDSFEMTKEGAAVVFGNSDTKENADRCIKYEFKYKYVNHGFADEDDAEVTCGFAQYYIYDDGRYYLMTYSGLLDENEGLGYNNYDRYYELLDAVVKNFRFTEAGAAEEAPEAEYERDEDGYRLVTDKRVAGFGFYLADGFEIDTNDGYLSATHADGGANIMMSAVTAAGASPDQYIMRKRDELVEIGATNFTFIGELDKNGAVVGKESALGNIPEDGENKQTSLSASYAFAYEYTYEFNGESYHVYQVIAADGWLFWYDAYVFTYTATEAEYAEHLDEVEAMLSKVDIK